MAELAERQWGVVSASQLRGLGVTTSTAARWLAAGRLQPLHRGVYAVGHRRLRPAGHWLAAVLACGEGAVLSHRSALTLWGLRSSSTATIDVTARHRLRTRAGIRVHESRVLFPEDVTTENGIPVTSVARTLLDVAALLPPAELESAVARALKRPGFDTGHLADIIARGEGHRGLARLARFAGTEPRITRREMERRFLALVRRAGLPEPETNVPMTFGAGERWEIDVLWRREMVSVELDSWRWHGDRGSFETDRVRAATLIAAGWRHLQFTWKQITEDPDWVIQTLLSVLDRQGA